MNLILRLAGKVVDGQNACCLGSQLARIVTLLDDSVGGIVWYAADIEAVGEGFQPPTQELCLVGQSHQFVELLKNVDQFLRGVFLAVKGQMQNPRFRRDIDTEDSLDVDLGDAVVEVRAFDTSYFEILTRDRLIGDVLANTFGVQVLSLPNVATRGRGPVSRN